LLYSAGLVQGRALYNQFVDAAAFKVIKINCYNNLALNSMNLSTILRLFDQANQLDVPDFLQFVSMATVGGSAMNPLKSAWGTIISGLVLTIIIALVTDLSLPGDSALRNAITIWLHVGAGVTWIGLLYYFNFVQVQALGEAASDEGGPGGGGITKYVAPRALLWFRWAALVTWLSGAFYLMVNGDLISAFTLGANAGATSSGAMYGTTIGIGAWMGTIMLFNVWILIWPNQKKILGMVEATADQIASAKSTALMASRTNTLLSLPMLMSMVGAHHGYFM
jgi:uncharacterized membrane protein